MHLVLLSTEDAAILVLVALGDDDEENAAARIAGRLQQFIFAGLEREITSYYVVVCFQVWATAARSAGLLRRPEQTKLMQWSNESVINRMNHLNGKRCLVRTAGQQTDAQRQR